MLCCVIVLWFKIEFCTVNIGIFTFTLSAEQRVVEGFKKRDYKVFQERLKQKGFVYWLNYVYWSSEELFYSITSNYSSCNVSIKHCILDRIKAS